MNISDVSQNIFVSQFQQYNFKVRLGGIRKPVCVDSESYCFENDGITDYN